MKKISKRTYLSDSFFKLGLLLLPYDALPVMPSTYRPIAVFPFLLAIIFYGIEKRKYSLFTFRHNLLIIFVILTIFINLLRHLAGNLSFEGYLDTILTIAIGMISYFAFSIFLRQKKPIDKMINWLFGILSIAYVVPVIVGSFEMLSLMGILPSEVNYILVSIFGGNQYNRLTVTSFEASWASIHLLISLISNLYLYKLYKKLHNLILIILSFILFLYTNSMQGILILCIASIIYIIMLSIKKNNSYLLIKWVLVILVLFFMFIAGLRWIFTYFDIDSYYATRILNFVDINHLIKNDASSFVRIMFPLICLQMFIDNPLFGIGAGGFAEYLPSYIYNSYPWALKFPEIMSYVNGSMIPSATCLYTRVFAELGIIGSLFFILFVLASCRNINKLYNIKIWQGSITIYFVIILLCVQFQFASYAYLPFWLALALLDCTFNHTYMKKRNI